MGNILVGTCSWTDPALVGSGWYPSSARGAEGRLGAVLMQFPPSLRPGPGAEVFLERCLGRASALGWRAAVEFRDPRWYAPERSADTADLAKRHGAALVAVDTARGLPASVPPVTAVTAPQLSVVRFHGRSPHWGTGSKEDSYRHRYTGEELAEWVPRIRALAERTDRVHVLFNNCCGDAAVRVAGAMSDLLG